MLYRLEKLTIDHQRLDIEEDTGVKVQPYKSDKDSEP